MAIEVVRWVPQVVELVQKEVEVVVVLVVAVVVQRKVVVVDFGIEVVH